MTPTSQTLITNVFSIALMCLSTATAMFVGLGVKRLMARRASGKAVAAPAKD
ncbi:MAG TPA: hypothetical protein VIY29_27630 [Ktedonobacteraceae bacterium]